LHIVRLSGLHRSFGSRPASICERPLLQRNLKNSPRRVEPAWSGGRLTLQMILEIVLGDIRCEPSAT
jgi:hypothetical protein